MDKKMTGIIAVVVVAVVVIAAAFVMMNKDDGGDDTDNSISFLIQDNKGLYFWIEGEGDTAIEAFQDAIGQSAYKDAAAFVPSTDKETGAANGITSLYGLTMTTDDSGNWFWWTQYMWTGSAWEQAQSYMNSYGATETNNYLAIVYGDGTNAPLAKPSDAKIWDGSTSGVKFTISSSSGMEFYINGQGTTMLDAFKDATSDYNIPFKPSTGAQGDYGIDSVFGIEMNSGTTEDGKTFYNYWAQYYRNSGEWGYGDGYMSTIQSSDYKECLVSYEYSVY
ncbi:MAG: hypothetical protein ACI38Y_05645 [Candidatus Methanomethylophilaceae archaeon]